MVSVRDPFKICVHASSVEMPFNLMNPVYLHNTMCICMIVYGTAFPRSPDQDELYGTRQNCFHSSPRLAYQIALPVPFIHEIASVVLARVMQSIWLPLIFV